LIGSCAVSETPIVAEIGFDAMRGLGVVGVGNRDVTLRAGPGISSTSLMKRLQKEK